MGIGQVPQAFSTFSAIFFWHIRFFSSFTVPSVRSILKKKIITCAINLAKNEENPRSTCLNLISAWHFQNPKPRIIRHYYSLLEKKIRRIPRKGKLGVMGDKNRWKRVHHLYSVIPSVNQFIQMIHRGIAM